MVIRLPLVRVEGKKYVVRPDLTLTTRRFSQPETKLQREARDEAAREAEACFGFEASLYFFAGIAPPNFGDIVLAYHPDWSESLEGNATTFDTGGMYLGHIRGRGLDSVAKRKRYVDEDLCDLGSWRARADSWVREEFAVPDDYLDPQGRPASTDPDDRLGHTENERRSWAFEVRLYSDWPIFNELASALVRQDFLQQALGSVDGDAHQRLLDLIVERRLRQAEPEYTDPCVGAVPMIKEYARGEALPP